MIDYIDNSFDLIEFPDIETTDKYRKEFFNINRLFNYDNKIGNPKNGLLHLAFNHQQWLMYIQSLRFDIEIPMLMSLLFFEKGIPEKNTEIEKLYFKYNWENYDEYDINSPLYKENYKKLFDTFIRFTWHSIISFTNKLQEQFCYLFNIETKCFKKDYIMTNKDYSDEIISHNYKTQVSNFITSFKNLIYLSDFNKLRKYRNKEVHSTGNFNSILLATSSEENSITDFKIYDEISSSEILDDLKISFELLSTQCDYFYSITKSYLDSI